MDSRDGQTYKTVTIGTQTWMAENLNYETANSYCYDDDASYCSKYGRLYTWTAAMDSEGAWSTNGKGCGYNKTCSPTYPVRGVCPEGWHLPTRAEFETLFTAVGGESIAGQKLKSTSGWNSSGNGTDAFAFSALPAGGRYFYGNYDYEGDYARFWSSTEDYSDFAYNGYLNYDDNAGLDYNYKNFGFSVRCLKDDGSTTQSSSSSAESSSSVTLATPCKTETEDNCEYGELTDSRDGQTYKTVAIGSQTWMAENINYETDSSFCYGDTLANCSKYGRLYTWKVATTVCPDGWHLPTKVEFETLFTAVGGQSTAGKVLKSTSGWYSSGNGTDVYSFSALPAGYRRNFGNYYNEGDFAAFWSSTQFNSDLAYTMSLDYYRGNANLGNDGKNYGFSVRCVKD